MAAESCSKAPDDSMPPPSSTKQRRKRKWDQPAEALISGNGTFAIPMTLRGSVIGTSLGTGVLHGDAPIQKLNQPKGPVELIAREITINDADPTVRYRLTKRQTQEEIQKATGTVVITRGKYRPPNSLPDHEKPLYLHISSGSHLKETAERIKAVDHAASIVEGILKQGPNTLSGSTTLCGAVNTGRLITQTLSTCVFLGFVPNMSPNIIERIRGPNDQYINHIMNVTGVTVVLRGQGVENSESLATDAKAQEPLHLYLSSNNPRSLEEARTLAENLLDTISVECGASRTSSGRVYNAVPPPPHLLATVQSLSNQSKANLTINTSSEASFASGNLCATRTTLQPGTIMAQSQSNSYPHYSVSRGTYYSGYDGIYPQATPLQQVAQALRRAPATSPITPVAVNTSDEIDLSMKKISTSSIESEKRPQKRKFQELMVSSSASLSTHQHLHREQSSVMQVVSPSSYKTIPPPKKQDQHVINGMSTPNKISSLHSDDMPPPPPKFIASPSPPTSKSRSTSKEQTLNHLPGPLMQLVEYGDEDDDEEGLSRGESQPTRVTTAKPFWAVG